MSIDLSYLASLTQAELEAKAADPNWLREAMTTLAQVSDDDRKTTQLAYYRPVNPMALPAHYSRAREVAMVGGNRSSKTDTMLAEMAIQMTGHIPLALQGSYPRDKIRAPIRARIVCNSLSATLEPVIKPKLKWDNWNGDGTYLDGRGHWGWIPQHCLKGGKWETAYSEKYNTLYVSVDNSWVSADGTRVTTRGYSSCQFMSYDQDIEAFSGSSLHFVGHDELPRQDIYRENKLRTLDTQGQIYTAFTPPDEAGASRGDVSWFFDTVYERGLPGLMKDPDIDTFILHTEKNSILSPEAIRHVTKGLTEEQREVRLLGRFIHLSGVIFGLFTAGESWWCYRCDRKVLPIDKHCVHCTGDDIEVFSHVVEPFVIPGSWPVVQVIDPHPRKKDAIGWFAITPSDDILQIGELEVDGTAEDVARAVKLWENAHRVYPVKRLMDPNIATETNDKLKRGWTIRKAYDEAGLRCDLADDGMATGIQAVNELLKPDPYTRRPRFAVFNTCPRTIYSFGHWTWDENVRSDDKDLKERPRDRHKDFCDVVRYVALDRPKFRNYTMGVQVYRPGSKY